ncbi:MBL fold metallo-hydrolase [Arthrobacter sp. SD76]|uniref:MBL fold metallo-hydrolase n=1 Tax=Arthrobacter sp. SD76 TaxID=3415007 RepID=UPI003C71B6FB
MEKAVMGKLDVVPVVDKGLGNSAFILDLGDGRALVLDPERDVREVRARTRQLGLEIAYAAETHLHADFISGVRELAEVDGAEVLAPDVRPRGFPVRELHDGETVHLGGLALQALATPGHSPEHLSYLVLDGGAVAGVFTGGSLMVGTAGRTDLVSPDQTVPLARAQYHSLQRLMELPDETPVWPTHGAGSFCSAAGGRERVTTIGKERATNPLLQAGGEDEFVQLLLGTLGTFPGYFLRLAAVNRDGPAVLRTAPPLRGLTAGSVRHMQAQGAQVVDVRAATEFASGHIPGAISSHLRPAFATWLGWLTNPDKPVIIVRDPRQDPAEIVWAAAKVGFDSLAGELSGGMAAWRAAGLAPAASDPNLVPPSLAPPAVPVVDVRQASEFAAGHVPGAWNIELGSLVGRLNEVPDGPVVVMCSHGERAMTAASILAAAGRRSISVLDGGPRDWQEAAGILLRVEG